MSQICRLHTEHNIHKIQQKQPDQLTSRVSKIGQHPCKALPHCMRANFLIDQNSICIISSCYINGKSQLRWSGCCRSIFQSSSNQSGSQLTVQLQKSRWEKSLIEKVLYTFLKPISWLPGIILLHRHWERFAANNLVVSQLLLYVAYMQALKRKGGQWRVS